MCVCVCACVCGRDYVDLKIVSYSYMFLQIQCNFFRVFFFLEWLHDFNLAM